MRKASHSWQNLILKLSTKSQKLLGNKNFREPGGILAFLTIVLAMLLWNWKLLLACSVGIASMTLVYSIQDWSWQKILSKLDHLLSNSNQRLIFAVVSGCISTFCTYISAVICVESHNHWVATGAILQGLATVLILVFTVCHIYSSYHLQQEKQFDTIVQQLTSPEPLKRFIAVSQLSKLATANNVDGSLRKNIVDLLHLLLLRETEVIVRESALESLQKLDDSVVSHSLRNDKPIHIPLKIKNKEIENKKIESKEIISNYG